MKLIADLHVHSKYSRATAKNLDLENLYIWSKIKGINIVGTGDITHPVWISEIEKKLVPAEPGLFKLKPDIEKKCNSHIPDSCKHDVRFILQGEISNIYKKNDKTRKNHHVVFLPDLASAKRFNAKLDAIGNIKSDGRPILGLDAKKLLKILLDTSSDAFLIPAHIWTPWFSVLGSKSGFDSLEECFEELTPEIFAVETGLSSDPLMNWRVGQLDKLTLVSNSDAHSPRNLARNANIFDIELSYFELKNALKIKDPKKCLGTFDMYPEEGKYHMDGHRKCNVCLHPKDTIKNNDICPVCKKPLVIGVLYRVETLATRKDENKPANALPCYHIIPLPEMLGELYGVGPQSKTVANAYQGIIKALGPEINILNVLSEQEIKNANMPLLDKAIQRMRNGDIHIKPGYDGEFGKIKVFNIGEIEQLLGTKNLPGKKKKKIILDDNV